MSIKSPTINNESELCTAFIEQLNAVPGWVCYPESAGFDILAVHESGRQIGVEAKLRLNAKVAEQILPHETDFQYEVPGPDHRIVIVGAVTEASKGIRRLLEMAGISVLVPWVRGGFSSKEPAQVIDFQLAHYFRSQGTPWTPHLFDWNPPTRCQVPVVVPNLPAGVPAPIRLTPWKEAALRLIIKMRQQGFITLKQFKDFGISPTRWTQGERPWLRKGEAQGQWVETEHLPPFEEQHSDAYAKLLEEALAGEEQP